MSNLSISETIDRWGQTEANRPVYYDNDHIFTYGDLKRYSDAIATYLQQNFDRSKPIVVFGELEFDMIVCFLAASKAGHAYIPIDTHTPKERIELILDVANPAVILSVSRWCDVRTSAKIIALDELETLQKNQIVVDLLNPVVKEETYYTIFTSGTTGTPKGVQISHDNLRSFVNWELGDFGIVKGMRFLSQAPYSFDLSVMDLYPALLSGGSLTPLRKEIIGDFKQLFRILPLLDIEVWVSTPSFMDICLMEPDFDQKHVNQLKLFLFCGEELPHTTAKKLIERFPSARIFNTYGPTEATVAISSIEVTSQLLEKYQRIPIGYIKKDTQVVIMAEEQELKNGETGEIIISGPSVSKGYLNNPEKTAQSFFTYRGQPAYRTGDAGHFEEELLVYEGRMDFQVKLHGYRIELEDIDHHLGNVSYVKQATVVPKYQENKVHQLVAFVVCHPHPFEKEFQLTKAIKKELGDTVMEYMIPNKFIYVDQLPLTTNGKIDRKGLTDEVNKR